MQNPSQMNQRKFVGNPAELEAWARLGPQYNFEPEQALPGTASSCLNGLRHGGVTRTLFIPGEEPQDFFNMLVEDFATHQPATTQDSGIVTDATLARWYLWRRQRCYAKAEFELYNQQDQEDTLNPPDLAKLEKFDRYRTQAERSLDRAMKGLRHLKKAALDEEKWRNLLELKKQRFALDRQKFELRQEQAAIKMRAAEVESQRFNVAEYGQHLTLKDGTVAIQQTANISEKEGVLKVDLQPSNDIVQRIVENRALYLMYAPEFIDRTFYFENGQVPAQYRWIVEKLPPDSPTAKIGIKISFDFWRKIYADEAEQRVAA